MNRILMRSEMTKYCQENFKDIPRECWSYVMAAYLEAYTKGYKQAEFIKKIHEAKRK